METRKQIAAEKKRCNSHNCAQAILHTYADVAGISEDDAMNIAGAFGGGMGNWVWSCLRIGQQGQGEVHETDAADYDQVPGKKRSHPMQATERCGYKSGTP